MTNLPKLLVLSFATELVLAASLTAQDPDYRRIRKSPDGFLFRAPRASLAVRGGFELRRADSGVFTFFTDELTLKTSDFSAFHLGGDLAIRMADPVDLVFSAGYTRSESDSEFRDWVDQDNLPITQTTRLYTVPVTASIRWYPVSRGRQVGRFAWIPAGFTPYLGAGAGMVRYSLRQAGSFVDTEDLSIFDDVLVSEGWAPVFLAMAGADYTLIPRVGLNLDARYLHGNGNLRRDFVGFTDGIDVSGFQFSLGLQFRM